MGSTSNHFDIETPISIHDGLKKTRFAGFSNYRVLKVSGDAGDLQEFAWILVVITYKSSAAHVSVEYSMHLLVDNPRLNHSHTARLKGSMELSIMSVAYLELLSCSIFPQAAYLHGIKRRWIVMESSFLAEFFMENNARETKGLTYK